MEQKLFADMYGNLPIPVLVCENTEAMPVVYMNMQAGILFAPSRSVDRLVGKQVDRTVDDLLEFKSPEDQATFHAEARKNGRIEPRSCNARTFEGKKVRVRLAGNAVAGRGAHDCFVLYMAQLPELQPKDEVGEEERLSAIINASFLAGNVNDSIQTVLAIAGQQQKVSRAYVFEEISATTTRNTYEWCAPGVEPAIQDLQDLKKEDYNYDVIVESGKYNTSDERTLPDEDREILEMQGIRSLAIIPLYDYGKPLGFVGFDDTENYREWSQKEITFLRNISNILATQIKRRNAEQGLMYSQSVLQIMLDASDDVVYANTLDDYTLKFVSRSLADALGKEPEELLGKVCWQVLQKDQTGPCDFCPIPHIVIEPGAERSKMYVWEAQNSVTGKTYLAKDSIVKWVDGQYVHVETAGDISTRKDYEEQLTYYASTDVMTGAYNRNWGGRVIEEKLQKARAVSSLVFVDLDGLKKVNDQYGHAAGDEMIVETVNALWRYVGPDEVICRWGGDEFLLWVYGSADEVQQRMAEAEAALDEYNRVNGKPFKLAFSYGVVEVKPGSAVTLDALVTDADKRMYESKMEKRGLALNRRRGDGTE
ncbi:MAG: diguanylate cyclase [Oscillospiraceae bacterium]